MKETFWNELKRTIMMIVTQYTLIVLANNENIDIYEYNIQ